MALVIEIKLVQYKGASRYWPSVIQGKANQILVTYIATIIQMVSELNCKAMFNSNGLLLKFLGADTDTQIHRYTHPCMHTYMHAKARTHIRYMLTSGNHFKIPDMLYSKTSGLKRGRHNFPYSANEISPK